MAAILDHQLQNMLADPRAAAKLPAADVIIVQGGPGQERVGGQEQVAVRVFLRIWRKQFLAPDSDLAPSTISDGLSSDRDLNDHNAVRGIDEHEIPFSVRREVARQERAFPGCSQRKESALFRYSNSDPPQLCWRLQKGIIY